MPWLRQSVRRHADGILWRAAALPLLMNLAFAPRRFEPSMLIIGRAYATRYWQPKSPGEWIDILVAILIWPVGVLFAALWFTGKNGAIVDGRFGRSRLSQLGDQLRLCVTSGLLPPWYYIFELYDRDRLSRARAYFTRGQTKYGAYRIFAEARQPISPLADKVAFAAYCAERRIAVLPVLLSVDNGRLHGRIRSADRLPNVDLFVKPVRERGGRGAERWDYESDGTYRNVLGDRLDPTHFINRLRAKSRLRPYLVQERALNHPAMRDLSNGALNTVRLISCLNESAEPEIVAAVLRMAVGHNVTVDNIHAGGIAAAINLADGRLSPATDIGLDAGMGWIERHPDTGGEIAGRILPLWAKACDLVQSAHGAFRDWTVVGWDVAIMADIPRLVEGNGAPDIELIQRPLRRPFGDSRFGALLSFHLERSRAVG